MKLSETLKRCIVGGIGLLYLIPLFIYSEYALTRWLLNISATLFVFGALYEYFFLAESLTHKPLKILGSLTFFSFAAAFYLGLTYESWAFLPWLFLTVYLFSAFLLFFKKRKNPFNTISVTTFGLFYTLLPLCSFFSLQFLPAGMSLVAFTFFVSKITDISAYFGGKNFGKRPLAPAISPKKTVEGALIGFTTAILTSLFIPELLNDFVAPISLSPSLRLFFGFTIGIIAQVGDLSESLLKRDANVKDTNNLPGLGGIMDVLDSLVFTMPLVYFTNKVIALV